MRCRTGSRPGSPKPARAHDMLTREELLALLPRLRCYARALTADLRRADELVLETLAHAAETWSPAPPLLRHRLFGVMHRLHGERSARERPDRAARGIAPGAGARPSPDPADADNMLARFSQLAVEEREVLVLVVLEALPYAEIAALLDVPMGTVMARLRRARAAINSTGAEPVALGTSGQSTRTASHTAGKPRLPNG